MGERARASKHTPSPKDISTCIIKMNVTELNMIYAVVTFVANIVWNTNTLIIKIIPIYVPY